MSGGKPTPQQEPRTRGSGSESRLSRGDVIDYSAFLEVFPVELAAAISVIVHQKRRRPDFTGL